MKLYYLWGKLPFYTPSIDLKTFGYKMETLAREGLNKIQNICMSQSSS